MAIVPTSRFSFLGLALGVPNANFVAIASNPTQHKNKINNIKTVIVFSPPKTDPVNLDEYKEFQNRDLEVE
jgi:predicted double-glycine peptidase